MYGVRIVSIGLRDRGFIVAGLKAAPTCETKHSKRSCRKFGPAKLAVPGDWAVHHYAAMACRFWPFVVAKGDRTWLTMPWDLGNCTAARRVRAPFKSRANSNLDPVGSPSPGMHLY